MASLTSATSQEIVKMHFSSLLTVSALAVGSLAWPRYAVENDGLSVQTSSGLIHGIKDSKYPNVRQFLGIPFAQPPTGTLRFEPPQPLPVSASKKVVNNTKLPPSCMQYLNTKSPGVYLNQINEFGLQGKNGTGDISEDCLTLSIWTPTSNNSCQSNGLLPVEIWIYGGGFSTGGQDVPYQIPTQWVQRTQDHLVVSLNYRVNIFGFPNAAGLSDQNVGLLDQRAAVEWVRDNIVRFGGDPSRMLLWGQSAGSISVDYYNYAYPKDPIVSAFSMDSGTAFSVIQSVDTQHTNFTFVASQLGCANSSSPAEELTCVRKLPASTIEDFVKNYQINGTAPSISFLPIADNKTVFSNYTERALAGLQANLPAIIGTNAQDGVPFAPYSPNGPNATLAQLALLTTFFCPATESIRLRQQTNLPTYRYVYSGNFSNIAPSGWLGAYHSSELPMLFGTYDNFRGVGPALEGETSRAMQDAWVAFTSGGMSGIESSGWQEYEVLGESTVRDFGDGVAVKDTDLKYLENLCDGSQPNYSA
ncbi:acetylcholinesterase [Aureobasidium subglaciale]|nr:acetylcholinesterase [Aureobasidium subglaciale]